MTRKRVTIVGMAVALVVVLVSGVVVFRGRGAGSPSASMQGSTSAVSLGFVYLPLTPGLSAYYDLGVKSGALVTEVVPNSPADRAGVRPGDVVLSFNGVKVEKEMPLFGMMRACVAGNRVQMEIWRGKSLSTIELIHTEN